MGKKSETLEGEGYTYVGLLENTGDTLRKINRLVKPYGVKVVKYQNYKDWGDGVWLKTIPAGGTGKTNLIASEVKFCPHDGAEMFLWEDSDPPLFYCDGGHHFEVVAVGGRAVLGELSDEETEVRYAELERE